MSYFQISFGQHALSAYPRPAQCGDFGVLVQYKGEPVELTAVSFSIRLGQSQVWPERFQPIPPIASRYTPWEQYLSLRVPLDAVTVSFIEQVRQGNASLNFDVSMNLYYHRLVPAPQPADDSQASPPFVLGFSEMQSVQGTCTIQRDEWLEVLKTIGWQEYEVFEVPTAPLRRVERLAKAYDLLDQAVKAFLAGDYDACVVRARRAIEAAAATTGISDPKQAISQLWLEVAPDTADKPKRDALDRLTWGISTLRNTAAHGGDLDLQLRRPDAHLALTVAIALFRYLGEELHRATTTA